MPPKAKAVEEGVTNQQIYDLIATRMDALEKLVREQYTASSNEQMGKIELLLTSKPAATQKRTNAKTAAGAQAAAAGAEEVKEGDKVPHTASNWIKKRYGDNPQDPRLAGLVTVDDVARATAAAKSKGKTDNASIGGALWSSGSDDYKNKVRAAHKLDRDGGVAPTPAKKAPKKAAADVVEDADVDLDDAEVVDDDGGDDAGQDD